MDHSFEEAELYDFYQWILDHQPTYGMLLGDQVNNWLGVNSINTIFIIHYLLRPLNKAQCKRMMDRYYDHCNKYHGSDLEHIKGHKIFLQGEEVNE